MKPTIPLLFVVTALLTGCGSHAPTVAGHSTIAPLAARSVQRDTPADVTKIRTLASDGLAAAASATDWDTRFAATLHALMGINEVPLQDQKLSDLASRMGILAANGYGYFGFHPPAEDKYKLQAVVLQYLAANQTESTLCQGTPIFTLAASMVSGATGYDQSCKIGISVLTCIRDYYKDANISHAADAILKKALQAADKATCNQVMLDGLKQLGQAAAVVKSPVH
jgi:hypothetical protein